MLRSFTIASASLALLMGTSAVASAGPAERLERLDNRLDRIERRGGIPQGSPADRWEDRLDRFEDRIDRREDMRDRAVTYGPRDLIEDRLDRLENIQDRRENRRDRAR